MSNEPRQRRPARLRKIAASAFAVLVATSTLGAPTASASPQDDIWRLINDQHILAGCRGYDGDDNLVHAAVNIARTMAKNDGQMRPNDMDTPTLLGYLGWRGSGFGEMRYYNPNGATGQDAVDFWSNANTRDLPKECGLQALGVGVWINDGNFAAVALTGARA